VKARWARLALGAALLEGCAATSPAPPSWQRTMAEAALTPYGAWANVTLTTGQVVSGELLAVDQQTAFVGLSAGLRVLPIRCVTSLRLAVYEGDSLGPGLVSFLGLLSTASHGFLLVFSAPVWGITAGMTTYNSSATGHRTFAARSTPDLEQARRFARFPAGLPPGYRERATAQQSLDERCGSTP
jgi:hypothetical protein